MPTSIEVLWRALREEGGSAQRRIDAFHPLDIYADFALPDRPGLVLFCPARPPEMPALKAIEVEAGRRSDGRWSLRVGLLEPRLLPVFAELCRDIVETTRSGIDPSRAGAVVVSRIDRWRTLMEEDAGGLGRSELRGLIGELLFLERELLPALGPDDAVRSWIGPLRAEQDFRLPDGRRIEVKAVRPDADRARINGLGQLDAGTDPLELAIVRLEDTGRQAADAETVLSAVARLRGRLDRAPAALAQFEALLRFTGWDERRDEETVVVRLAGIERHPVGPGFPRLTTATVPEGIVEATYTIMLPRAEP